MSTSNNTNNTTTSLKLIPETVLKKKHDLDEMKLRREAAAAPGNRKIFSSKKKAIKIIKPEKFLSRANSRLHHERRFKRVNKKGMQKRASDKQIVKEEIVSVQEGDERGIASSTSSSSEVEREVKRAVNSVGANLIFAIRIRNERSAVPHNVKRALGRMRLRNVNEGVFLRYDESTRKLLHLVEPWVLYGVPSKSTITDLLKRRGHLRIENKRVPLSDNTLIEEHLGNDYNMLCVEDVVHELHSVGESFHSVNKFLWPFRLAAFSSRFQKRVLDVKDGKRGEYGDVGESMDELIRKVL